MALAGIDVIYRREFVDHPVDLKKVTYWIERLMY